MNFKPNHEAKISRTHTESAGSPEKERLQGRLTTPVIIILVMAMLAPISGFAGLLPLAIGLGNGAGMPGTFLITTLIMLCFAAGYAAISRHVKETGAFYAYITKGLGRPVGGAGAFIALLNYIVAFGSFAGGIGYFSWSFVHQLTGLNIPWWVYTLISIAIIAYAGSRNIDVSSKILIVLLIVEVSVLSIFIIGAFIKSGFDFPLSSFAPSTMFSGGWNGFSIGLMFSFFLFSGVEIAAVYAEESRNPERTVASATYGGVLVIGIFYILMTWSAVAIVGVANVQSVAMADLGQFSFNVIGQVLGKSVQMLVSVMVIISLLAAMIGFHQAVARYMVAMGRDNLLPRFLAHIDPVHKSPQVASLVSAVIYTIIMILFAISGSDPFTTIFATFSALTVMSTLTLWVLVSVAFIVYFRRHADPRWLTTFVLPIIALVMLGGTLVMVLKNYTMLTNSNIGWINNLPWILIPFFILGVWRMLYLRSKKPEVYALIWRDDVEMTAINQKAVQS